MDWRDLAHNYSNDAAADHSRFQIGIPSVQDACVCKFFGRALLETNTRNIVCTAKTKSDSSALDMLFSFTYTCQDLPCPFASLE
jgi:hypothetical protein